MHISQSIFLSHYSQDPYVKSYEKQITGCWTARSAGGCANNRDSYGRNPIYQLKIENTLSSNCLQIEIKGPKVYSVGFEIVALTNQSSFTRKTTEPYRHGYSVERYNDLPGGVYNIIPSTFRPNQEAHFFLIFNANVPFSITTLQQ